MFGYIRPLLPELKVRELAEYKAVYCGLCGELGRSFGPLARLCLSYDFTFLSMLRSAVSGNADAAKDSAQRRCYVNPFKKIRCAGDSEALRFGADVAAIMLYYKLLDNIADSSPLKKSGWFFLRPFAAAAYKKAAARQPEAAGFVKESVSRQAEIEACRSGSLDEAAEPTAAAMAGLFGLLARPPGDGDPEKYERQCRALSRLGYLTGRYVYLCDALDDLRDDLKCGGYNPLIIGFNIAGDDGETIKKAESFAKESLYMTAGEAVLAYNLLDIAVYRPVLDNIVCLGLKSGVDAITERTAKHKNVIKLGDA